MTLTYFQGHKRSFGLCYLHLHTPVIALQPTVFRVHLSYYTFRLTLWWTRALYNLVDLDLFSRSPLWLLDSPHLSNYTFRLTLWWTRALSWSIFKITRGHLNFASCTCCTLVIDLQPTVFRVHLSYYTFRLTLGWARTIFNLVDSPHLSNYTFRLTLWWTRALSWTIFKVTGGHLNFAICTCCALVITLQPTVFRAHHSYYTIRLPQERYLIWLTLTYFSRSPEVITTAICTYGTPVIALQPTVFRVHLSYYTFRLMLVWGCEQETYLIWLTLIYFQVDPRMSKNHI